MTQAVILGLTGEPGLWLADFQSGTITAVNEPLSDELSRTVSLRNGGMSIIKGIDFAAAIGGSELPAAGIHEGNH